MTDTSLQSARLYTTLTGRSDTDSAARALVAIVDEVFEDCLNLSKAILRFMPEYTLHDGVHLRGVVDLMDRVIPERTLTGLGTLELAALILSAGLHDIGMAPSEEEVEGLLGLKTGTGYEKERKRFLAFRQGYADLSQREGELRSKKMIAEAQAIQAYILGEYLRLTHAQRGRDYIFRHYADRLKYKDFNFTARLAQVCFSHSTDISELIDIPCWDLVRAPGEYCNWRFLALVLRLADVLDFDPKRTPRVLFENLGIRSTVSVREWRKHQSVIAWDIRPGRVAFSAQCADPVVEKCVRDFAALIEREIKGGRGILEGMHDPAGGRLAERYRLDLPPTVDTRGVGPAVGPDGRVSV